MNQKRKKENDNEYISAVVHGRDMARISKQMTLINFVDHHYVIIILFDCKFWISRCNHFEAKEHECANERCFNKSEKKG